MSSSSMSGAGLGCGEAILRNVSGYSEAAREGFVKKLAEQRAARK